MPLCALLGLVVLTALVVADWAPLNHVDHGISTALRRYGEPRDHLVAVLRILTDLAATATFLSAGAVTTIALALRRQRSAALLCATVTGVVPLLWGVAHWLLPHPRPTDGFVTVASNGFPSGHTSNATAVALVAVLLGWPRLARTGRLVLVAAATAFAVVIGLTRVALLAHWPTDVLGGWLLALAVVPLVGQAIVARTPARDD